MRARALLDTYLGQHPGGALAEEALALSIEAAVAHGDSDAGSLADRYLRLYPAGPFRSLARQTLASLSAFLGRLNEPVARPFDAGGRAVILGCRPTPDSCKNGGMAIETSFMRRSTVGVYAIHCPCPIFCFRRDPLRVLAEPKRPAAEERREQREERRDDRQDRRQDRRQEKVQSEDRDKFAGRTPQ